MASSAKPPARIEKRLTVAERKRGYLVVNPSRRQFSLAEVVPFRVRTDDKSFETTVEVIRSLDEYPPTSTNRVSADEYELTMISR
jgi:hypothetical protein